MNNKYLRIMIIILIITSCDNSFDTTNPFGYKKSKIDNSCMKNSDCLKDRVCKFSNKDIGYCIKNPCLELNCKYGCKLDKDFISYCSCNYDYDCNKRFICDIKNKKCINDPCLDFNCNNGKCRSSKKLDNKYLTPYCLCNEEEGYYYDHKNSCITPCLEANKLKCKENLNGGRCIATDYNSYYCKCSNGYYADETETECVTPCKEDSCNHNKDLSNICKAITYNKFNCICNGEGFYLSEDNNCINQCEESIDDIPNKDNCKSSEFNNRCHTKDSVSYYCSCDNNNGYYSNNDRDGCNNPCIDDISSNNCLVGYSGNSCISDNYYDFHCECDNSNGYYSNIENNRCNNPCKTPQNSEKCAGINNRGICISENFNDYHCECNKINNIQYYAEYGSCVSLCDDIDCVRGECHSDFLSYECICDDGYTFNRNKKSCEMIIPFVTRWKTDNLGKSNDNQVILPVLASSSHNLNYDVDCNYNGEVFNPTATAQTGEYICTYDEIGVYNIAVKGEIPRIFFSGGTYNDDKLKLLSVIQWGSIHWESLYFYNCSNLVVEASDTPNLSDVTRVAGMFTNNNSLNQNIDNWDISTITDISSIFLGATSFNQSLNSWDVSNVTKMNSSFKRTLSFNQSLDHWDTSNVISTYSMFENSSFNQDIGNWNVSNVVNMDSMFKNSSFNQDIGNWNVSNVVSMKDMFLNGNFSRENYDLLLNSWKNLELKENVEFNLGNTTYCNGEEARQYIIETYHWIILDGGKNCE